MNILISTTTNWNHGDQFILLGVKNVLKNIVSDVNYIYYDRNPNNMIDYPNDQRMREGLRGGFMNNPINWDIIDAVVLAGSPEFLHHPLAPIYEGLLNHPEIPLLVIGVGYSEPYFILPLTDAETTVLKRSNTLIISRQQELSVRLSELISKEVHTLPCPALFCFTSFAAKKRDRLYIRQSKEYNGDADVAYHCLEDINGGGFFSSDPHELLAHIGQYKNVTSERLHGAIAAISSGAKALCVNESFRATEAMKLFKSVENSGVNEIQDFKDATLAKYIDIINNEFQI